MVITETVYPVLTRQRRLCRPCFRNAQVIEAEIAGKVWLIMPIEERAGLHNVAPFRETCAPRRIVLRNRMILGQVKRDCAQVMSLSGGADARRLRPGSVPGHCR